MKLNKGHKIEIAAAAGKAFERTNQDALGVISKKESQLNAMLIKEFYPAALLEQVAQLPRDLFDMRSAFFARLANGHSLRIAAPEGEYYPGRDRSMLISKSKKAVNLHEEIGLLQETYNVKHNEFRAELGSLLAASTTDKKFLELWPEGKAYLPAQPVCTAIAVNTTKLNAFVGK